MHAPAVIIMLICTSQRFYARWYDLGIGIVAPLFGIGIVIMAAVAPENEVPMVGGRLLLVAFFFYFMIGLRFREAVRANLIVFAALAVAIIASPMPGSTGTYLLFTLFCANLIGSRLVCPGLPTARPSRAPAAHEVATHDGLTTLLNRAASRIRFAASGSRRSATGRQCPSS